jgi:DNA-binding GntR family transcriptional regulator
MSSSRVQEFADRFREAINTGAYPPGAQLPRVIDVATEHSVSKGLIQDAYARLRDEGLVETIRRRGTFVRDQTREQIPWTNLVRRDSTGYVIGAPSPDWSVLENLGTRTTSAPAGIDKLLKIDPQGEVLVKEHLLGLPADRPSGRAKRQPTQLTTIFFPAWVVAAVPLLTQPDPSPGRPLDRIEESIGGPMSWTEQIGSEPATPDDARHLQLAAGSPVLRIFTVGVLPDGRPVEAMVRTLSGQRFRLGPLPLVRDASAAWPHSIPMTTDRNSSHS